MRSTFSCLHPPRNSKGFPGIQLSILKKPSTKLISDNSWWRFCHRRSRASFFWYFLSQTLRTRRECGKANLPVPFFAKCGLKMAVILMCPNDLLSCEKQLEKKKKYSHRSFKRPFDLWLVPLWSLRDLLRDECEESTRGHPTKQLKTDGYQLRMTWEQYWFVFVCTTNIKYHMYSIYKRVCLKKFVGPKIIRNGGIQLENQLDANLGISNWISHWLAPNQVEYQILWESNLNRMIFNMFPFQTLQTLSPNRPCIHRPQRSDIVKLVHHELEFLHRKNPCWNFYHDHVRCPPSRFFFWIVLVSNLGQFLLMKLDQRKSTHKTAFARKVNCLRSSAISEKL